MHLATSMLVVRFLRVCTRSHVRARPSSKLGLIHLRFMMIFVYVARTLLSWGRHVSETCL